MPARSIVRDESPLPRNAGWPDVVRCLAVVPRQAHVLAENTGVSIALSLALVSGSTRAGDYPAPRNPFFAKPNRRNISIEELLPKSHMLVCSCKSAMRISRRRKAAIQRHQQAIADLPLILKVLRPPAGSRIGRVAEDHLVHVSHCFRE